MPCIKIDKSLQKSEEVANLFSSLMKSERFKFPKLSILQILLGKARPGLNSDVTSSSVISRFSEIGIPTGPLENGNPNVMEQFAKIIVEEIFDSIQDEMRTDVAVDQGMLVASVGANAGGPVASTGTNPAPHTATGISS